MKELKYIKVTSEKESKYAQKYLFNIGFKWIDGDKNYYDVITYPSILCINNDIKIFSLSSIGEPTYERVKNICTEAKFLLRNAKLNKLYLNERN